MYKPKIPMYCSIYQPPLVGNWQPFLVRTVDMFIPSGPVLFCILSFNLYIFRSVVI